MHVTYCSFPESLINLGKNIFLVFHIRMEKIKINGGQPKLISHTSRTFFSFYQAPATAAALNTTYAFSRVFSSCIYLFSFSFLFGSRRSPARNHFENNNEDGFNSGAVQRAEAFINVQSSTGF